MVKNIFETENVIKYLKIYCGSSHFSDFFQWQFLCNNTLGVWLFHKCFGDIQTSLGVTLIFQWARTTKF
jgi:hypothetical protein